MLVNQGPNLLAFAAALDKDLAAGRGVAGQRGSGSPGTADATDVGKGLQEVAA